MGLRGAAAPVARVSRPRAAQRRWSSAEQARIVSESHEPGATVVAVAARHGISTWSLSRWRRRAREGALPAVKSGGGRAALCPGGGRRSAAGSAGDDRGWRRRGAASRGQPGGADRGRGSGSWTGLAMIPGPSPRIVLATRPVDFRRGHDALTAAASLDLGVDIYSGVIVIFRSKRGDRLKILAWDGTGLVLTYKRLEEGRFAWPWDRGRDGAAHAGPVRSLVRGAGLAPRAGAAGSPPAGGGVIRRRSLDYLVAPGGAIRPISWSC